MKKEIKFAEIPSADKPVSKEEALDNAHYDNELYPIAMGFRKEMLHLIDNLVYVMINGEDVDPFYENICFEITCFMNKQLDNKRQFIISANYEVDQDDPQKEIEWSNFEPRVKEIITDKIDGMVFNDFSAIVDY